MSAHIPRKRFGQNFLVDKGVIQDIVSAIRPQADDRMVEIGPGLGALTNPLLQSLNHLHCVEIDRDIIARLHKTYPAEKLTVHGIDALKFDFGALGDKLRIVGNLPYNISTPILFHLLGAAAHVADQHLMLQKEVADRIAAEPGGAAYGRLSVMLQWRYRIDAELQVPPSAFEPPPKVDSTVIAMRPLPAPPALDQALLGELVAAAFSQRRKLLRHSLGRWLAARGADGGFDLQRRAQEVPVGEYVALAQQLGAG